MQQMVQVPVVLIASANTPDARACQLFSRMAIRGIIRVMTRALTNAICATLPGAEVSDPWGGGHDCWKVGGKMFADIGAMSEGVAVKTDSVEMAEMLIGAGVGERAKYLHRSWVYLPEDTPEDELRHRLLASYRIIRAGLPKKVQAALAPAP